MAQQVIPVAQSNIVTCSHFREQIPVGNGYILATEYYANLDLTRKPVPDIGFYLSPVWENYFAPVQIYGAPHLKPPILIPYPVILVSWEDGQGTQMALLEWLVETAEQEINKGGYIELACYGAHGRTGTLAACILGSVENLNAKEAIEKVRHYHCPKAVETRAQAVLVAEFLGSDIKTVANLVSTFVYQGGYQSGMVWTNGAWGYPSAQQAYGGGY